MKKLISAFLSAVMIISMLPMGIGSAAATEAAVNLELATSIAVGDRIVITGQKSDGTVKFELTGFEAKYGLGTAFTDTPAGTYILEVCQGTADGSFALKTADGKYLYAEGYAYNTLGLKDTLDNAASWNVTVGAANGRALISNCQYTRRIMYYFNTTKQGFYTSTSTSSRSYYHPYIYKVLPADACEHVWGEWEITTAPGCTTEGEQTATCTLCSETKTEPVSATGHTYVYGNTAILCENCDYSRVYDTIKTAQTAGLGTSGPVTPVHFLKGIVTYINGGDVFIEDDTAGIMVYFPNEADAAPLALGDEIVVWDTLRSYAGTPQTSSTTSEEFVIVSSGNELPATTVTIDDLLADTTNEYLCKRVVIENAVMGEIIPDGNTLLYNENDKYLKIHEALDLNPEIAQKDIVNVTAIVHAYNGYRLIINPGTMQTDVVKVAYDNGKTVSIAEAKVGIAEEEYQVEGTVTFIYGKDVYIQDDTGGIVVRLKNNPVYTKIGDTVRACGVLNTENGLILLDAVNENNPIKYSVLSSDNAVEAQTVTIADLVQDTENEYLGEKIQLNHVYVSTAAKVNSRGQYTLKDGDVTIMLRNVPLSESVTIGSGNILNVEAIVTTDNGYFLMVESFDKITVVGTCAHDTTKLVNAVAATCTEPGYSGDTRCVFCNYRLDRGEDIAPTGHSYDENGVCQNNCGIVNVAALAGEFYTSFADAYNAFIDKADTQPVIKLLMDVHEEITVDSVVVDLNGKSLSGITATGVVYALDSCGDDYTDVNLGRIAVNGTLATNWVAPNTNRYIAIEHEGSYTMHRMDVGITKLSLVPHVTGFGYKAEFLCDPTVRALVANVSYDLWLTEDLVVNRSVEGYRNALTLLLKNFLVDTHGEEKVYAKVSVTLADGTVIQSDTVAYSMRDMLEMVNDKACDLSTEQLSAVKSMIEKYPIMKTWGLTEICPAEDSTIDATEPKETVTEA